VIVPNPGEGFFAVLREDHSMAIPNEKSLQQSRIRGEVVNHEHGRSRRGAWSDLD